ncbi:MAG: hypothetical protein ABEJ23_05495 [Haloarculaceae archaeon]
MPSTRSRRRLLAGLGTGAAGLLAGCSGSTTSSTADCTTDALARGDGDLIQQAVATADGDGVVLAVTLTERALESDLNRLAITDHFGHGAVVPVTDAREYEQSLGRRPRHGRLVVVAVGEPAGETPATGASGPKLDSLTVEYHCSADGA